MSKGPEPPYLELSFYLADVTDGAGLSALASEVMRGGARLEGTVRVHRGPRIGERVFASITDEPLQTMSVSDRTALGLLMSDPLVRVIQVDMVGVVSGFPDRTSILTFQSVSVDAAKYDHHPVAVWTDGEVFSGPFRTSRAEEAGKSGMLILRTFLSLVEQLRPSYAAITSEYPLECPFDLRKDPRSLAFCNFYVSASYLQPPARDRIRSLYAEAHVEEFADGLYVSCSREFNSSAIDLPGLTQQRLSREASRIIASAPRVFPTG